MSYNRATAPAALEAFFKTLLGTPYSEQSPAGSDGDGHLWVPGEGKPNHLDCSGAMHYVFYEVTGIQLINDGNAEMQWGQHPQLRVTLPQPGDALYFLGSGPPPVGHTGMCLTYDSTTGEGTYISAYDTADALCIKPFSIHGGADGYVGAVRVVNLLPAPPPPPAPKPKPKPQPVPVAPAAAHAYAKAHGMVTIDHAEALLAIAHGISWYVWKRKLVVGPLGMVGSRSKTIPTNQVLFAFAKSLDAAHIPHAGS